MKQVIRHDTFETNSSSVHSLAIPKHTEGNYPNSIHFRIGEFGWEFTDGNDPASYLYTAILTYFVEEKRQHRQEKLDYLKEVLDRHYIEYTFDEPIWWKGNDYDCLDNGNIDHSNALGEFLEAVFATETTLLDFIFYGIVVTGNDNSEDSNPDCNYYYDKDYDWYYKGN